MRREGKVLILAGDFAQAARFANEEWGLERGEWTFAVNKYIAHGQRDPIVYVVGTYAARPDIDEILNALAPTQPNYLDESGHEPLWARRAREAA